MITAVVIFQVARRDHLGTVVPCGNSFHSLEATIWNTSDVKDRTHGSLLLFLHVFFFSLEGGVETWGTQKLIMLV